MKPDCGSGARGRHAATPMRPATSLPLANAFLALSDDGVSPDQRTLPRMVTATLAAVALAVGVPLGWYLAPRAAHPVATLSSKTALSDGEE
jgi:hypothetical protein